MTDSPVPPAWRTTVHLVGLGVLAALVTFTTADLAQVRASFERTFMRPPTANRLLLEDAYPKELQKPKSDRQSP